MSNTETAAQKVEKMISDAEAAMNDAEVAKNEAETAKNEAKTEMDARYKELSMIERANTPLDYKELKKNYNDAGLTFTNADKDYKKKQEKYLKLKTDREKYTNDDEFLKSIDEATLYKLQNPTISKFSNKLKALSPVPITSSKPASPSMPISQSSATVSSFVEIDDTPGKEITIKFVQHPATKQCFIKEYNICDAPNAKQSINVEDADLPSRLVLDTNNQPVTDNIQNLSKIVTRNCQAPVTIAGGYDAMKRSRSVGTKRKTIRQAKRHARRSRRSRPSRFSL
jgi:hypothetical protein